MDDLDKQLEQLVLDKEINYQDEDGEYMVNVTIFVSKAKALIDRHTGRQVLIGRIDENQRRLDKIIAWNNRKPVPGELTSASFGSAGGAMEIEGFKHSFEGRLAELQSELATLERKAG